jgi:protein-tyrosine kinase
MTIKPTHPIAASGSLIERAAEIYDFQRIIPPMDAPVARPVAAPASVEAPAPIAAPAPVVVAPVRPAAFVPLRPAAPQRAPMPVDMAMLRDAGFIQPDAPPTALSEEFRLVKRQLLLAALGGRNASAVVRGRAILVCSAQPNEGKTFCSVNLALSMSSESDIEVLLVDADVAKPEILSTLGLQGGPGLMDALSDPSLDVEDLIIPTSVPKLSVLSAGRQTNSDTEVLASARSQEVIDRMIAHNPSRIIIFDSAPTLAASPSSVIAHLVGQVLMVVRADRTGETELREAIALLDGCEHIQLLLNGVSYAGGNQKFGSYYGYGG